MVVTSNEIGQARQWVLRTMLCAMAFAMGCTGQSPDSVYGRYSIDRNELLQQDDLRDLRSAVKESVTAMATGLSASVIYEFGAQSCARVINGNREPFQCDFVRIEKKRVVVFRSRDVRGLTRYLRLTPTDTGINLDTGIRSVPLKRIVTDGS